MPVSGRTRLFLAMLMLPFSAVVFASQPILAEDNARSDQPSRIDLGQTGIDPVQDRSLLSDLQAHIIEEHDSKHALFLFLRFGGDVEAAKRWVGGFAEKYLTSADNQAKTELRGGFYLSAGGYEKLGFREKEMPKDDAFLYGMKDREMINRLGDPPIDQWEAPYQQPIDALALLAHNDPEKLDRTSQEVRQSLRNVAEILTVETARRMVNADGLPIEHFGFVDGISQPLFMQSDIKQQDSRAYDASAPSGLVLRHDTLGAQPHSCGSFLVVRKLRQDVAKFNEALKTLADALGISQDLAGAYVVGRFKDGTPVVLRDKPGVDRSLLNAFNYDADSNGAHCPFHAHIRKLNPRGSSTDRTERDHRIARRGMPYGVEVDGKPFKEGDVGQIFMCFQADIGNQFVFMQEKWANTNGFPRSGSGPDPLIGKQSRGRSLTGQPVKVPGADTGKYPTKWGEPERKALDFSRCVEMRGGEFFFAPSLSFLRSLKKQ